MSLKETGPHKFRQLVQKAALPILLLFSAPPAVQSNEIPTFTPASLGQEQLLSGTEPNLVAIQSLNGSLLGINRRPLRTAPDSDRWSVIEGKFDQNTLVLKPVHNPDFKVYELSGKNQFDVALGDNNQGVFTTDGQNWHNIKPFVESGKTVQTYGVAVLPDEKKAIAQIQIDSATKPEFRVIDQTGSVNKLAAQTIPSAAQAFATPAYKVDDGHLIFSNFEPADQVNGPKNSLIVNKITSSGLVQSLIQIADPEATKVEILSSDLTPEKHIVLVLAPKTADPTKNPARIIRYNVATGQQTVIATTQPSSLSNNFMRIEGVIENTLAAVSNSDSTCILKATIFPVSDTNFAESTQVKCFSNANPQIQKIFNNLGDWRDGVGKLAFVDNLGQKSLVVAYQDRSVVTKTIGDLSKPDDLIWTKAIFAPPDHQYYIPVSPVSGNLSLK